ncbi:MAG: zinc ribbon domain-containing protein [Gammaproteobacteria bacterium]
MAEPITGKTCPACGKPTPDASHCTHCGAPLKSSAPRRFLASETPGADYGIYLLGIPLISIVGLLIVALAAHSLSGLVWMLVLTAIVTAAFAAGEIFQSHIAWESGNPLKPMFGWLGFVALLWPVGYPAYLRARRRFKLGNWLIAALVVEVMFIAGAILAGVIIVTGYGKPLPGAAVKAEQELALLKADPHWIPDPDDVRVVQTAYLDNCPGKTVEQEVNGFFASPRWQAGATSEGRDFVNVSGIVTYQGKSATAVFQFLMNKDKSGFKYQAFSISGVPQSLYVAAFTLAQMCGS